MFNVSRHRPFSWIIVGALLNFFLVTQVHWGFKHGDFDDLALRMILAVALGSVLALGYFGLLDRAVRGRNPAESRAQLKKTALLHLPLYLSWLTVGFDGFILPVYALLVFGSLLVGSCLSIWRCFRTISPATVLPIFWIGVAVLVFGGFDSKYFQLIATVLVIALLLLLLLLPGYYLISLAAERHLNGTSRFLLAMPSTILILAPVFMVSKMLDWHYNLTTGVNVLLMVAIIAIGHLKGVSSKLGRSSAVPRLGLTMVFLASVLAASFVAVGTENPSNQIKHPSQVGRRHLFNMMIDNALQFRTANVFTFNKKPWGGWRLEHGGPAAGDGSRQQYADTRNGFLDV